MVTSRAAVLDQAPGSLRTARITVDDPGPDEVLVKTAAAGVCHSDLQFMQGTMPHPVPTVLGHESAGVVVAVGSGVADLTPGDHVISCLSLFCGHCEFCLSGRPVLCPKNGLARPAGTAPRLSLDGAPLSQFLGLSSFSEYLLVHQHALVRINPAMPLDVAATLGCGVLTGLGAVFRTAAVRPGETVAVIGCGGVGLSAVHGAQLAGASRVIAVDLGEDRRALAQRLGATDFVDAAAGDPVAQVRELTDGGVEHAFEAVGAAPTTAQAFAMLRKGGTATVIGMFTPGATVSIPGLELLQEKKLQGSLMGSNRFRIDLPRYVELYLQGRLHLDELVTARISLDDVNDAYARLGTGAVARQVIVFD